MGRKTLESSVFERVFWEVVERDNENDSASHQAWAAVEIARKQREERRRETKRNSAHMRRQLLGTGYSEPGEAPPKKRPITIWLDESQVAILNAEAKRLGEDLLPDGSLPIEYWRSVVIDRLLTSLNSDNQRHEKGWEETTVASQAPVANDHRKGGIFGVDEPQEETITALQDIIASERKRGIPDADIQREVDKSHLNMTLDEVMNYQFKTGNWNPRLSSTQPLP